LDIVEIPESIEGPTVGLKRGGGGQYRCTRMPYLNINDMGAAIRAANMEIVYAKSTGGATFRGRHDRSGNGTCRLGGHELTKRGLKDHLTGTPIGECEHREATALSRRGIVQSQVNTDFEPASRSDDEIKFQFVYTLGQMMTIYEIADTLATQADLLADIKTQGTTDQSGF